MTKKTKILSNVQIQGPRSSAPKMEAGEPWETMANIYHTSNII